MWDFILVLGQVPGTNIQITFSELLMLFDAALLLWLACRHGGVRMWLKNFYIKGSRIKNSI